MPALAPALTTTTAPSPAAGSSADARDASAALVLVASDGRPSTSPPRREPRGRLARRLRAVDSEAGMTTAEYAIGTVAACGFGGVLYKLITSDFVFGLLKTVISRALQLVF